MRTFPVGRSACVLVLIAITLVVLAGRVAYLQTYARQAIVQSAERQQHTTLRTTARRGSIFDRNGVLMAGTVQDLAVYVDPKFMLDQYQTAPRTLEQMRSDLDSLAWVLDVKPDDLLKLINERHKARYVRIAEHQSEAAAAEVMKLRIPGVGVEPVSVREYPMGSLAAHVLGSVGKDGRGLEGMELKFESTLAGKNGLKRLQKDARLRPTGIDAEDYVPPVHGQHLVLTIDANIQMIAEQELTATCEKYKPRSGEVVVIDPQTGDILAMANWPTFNPRNPGDSPTESRLNRAALVPYEPGSTCKPFTMGPALAWGVTRMEEVWPIHGATYFAPYGRRVSDVHGYGPLTSWDVLVKSSNIGMAMLAERMGNAKLHKALTGFEFGRKTGIELPEDPGLVNPLPKWTRYSTESVAQGYELMVTPLQLARAFAAFGNGGRLVKPRLVTGVLDAEGNVVERYAEPKLENMPRVIAERAADQIRQILSDVPVRGTASGQASKYWNIFGKTGTSHISRGGSYASNLYNSSFIGGAPLEEPKLIIAMVIHEPHGAKYGGTVAGPAAIATLERSLGYLQEPQSPPLPLPPANVRPLLWNLNPKLYERPREEPIASR